MIHLLQRHALPIKAQLKASLVLAYALPAEVLTPLLPPGLLLDTYGDYGFLAIALVETQSLRPAFLPPVFGVDFFLSGYRIFTRYRTAAGRNLRGLRILRSDTDSHLMRTVGNLLTHYGYERSQCTVRRDATAWSVQVKTPNGSADLEVEADLSPGTAALPAGSPFASLTEARRFAGPLPFTFDYERQTHSIIRVQGVRQAWTPRPVPVIVRRNAFLEQEAFRGSGAVLANAFFLEDVSYAWQPGIREVLP